MAGIRVRVDDEMRGSVCRGHRVCETALSGSVLREEFTPISDVDVLVEFLPESQVASLYDRIRFKHGLEDRVFFCVVDLVETSGHSPSMADALLKGRRAARGYARNAFPATAVSDRL